MSKQVYIDENGNEIQVSGTVNTADMMPMSGNDSTKVSEAIGNLSTLTTTDKSSIVGAVNEVVSTKQDKLLIQSGEKTGSGGVIPNGVNTYSVTFATPYASVPAVQVCFSSSTSQFLQGEIQKCATSNVTKTGFDIITACAQSRYATVRWLAIGYE